MSPYEIEAPGGSIHIEERNKEVSIDRLRLLAGIFRHSAWLNPRAEKHWYHVPTIQSISEIFPMFELTLDGLEKAVAHLIKKS